MSVKSCPFSVLGGIVALLIAMILASLLIRGRFSEPAPDITPSAPATAMPSETADETLPPLLPTAEITDQPTIPPTNEPAKPVHLSLKMIDQNNGWAKLYRESTTMHILHTTDGGIHWRDVTPALTIALRLGYPYPNSEFYDANTGWLLYDSILWHTTDGGESWSQTPFDENESYCPAYVTRYEIDFVSPTEGWILLLNFTHFGEDAWLYQTKDGGLSWECVSIGYDLTSFGHSMIFADASLGWMPLGGRSDTILRTNDGGRSWVTIDMASPEGVPSSPCGYEALKVFSTDSFMALAHCYGDYSEFPYGASDYPMPYLYTTNDSGETWSINRLPDVLTGEIGFPNYDLDMISPVTGWVVVAIHERLESLIYQTLDGGEHWTLLSTIPVVRDDWQNYGAAYLDFVDAEVGWLYVRGGTWMKTEDGGRTWTEIEWQIGE